VDIENEPSPELDHEPLATAADALHAAAHPHEALPSG
jgi:hypothetical protein